jgi:membrane protein YdbS with pleckstrin-like domain
MFPKPSRHDIKKYQKYLAPGEELAYVTHIGNKYYWSIVASCIMVFIMLASITPLYYTWLEVLPVWIALPISLSGALVLIPLTKILHERHSLVFIFTSRRVIIKKGIFSISITTAPYDKITHVQVEQKLLERMFYDTGTMIVHTAGPTPVEMKLVHIEKPFAVKNIVDDLTHQERKYHSSPVSQPWPKASIGSEVMIVE